MSSTIEIVGTTETVRLRDDVVDYLRIHGGSGWGKVPVANFKTHGSAPGWRFRGQRATGRILTIPALVLGSNPAEINDRVRKLVRVTSNEFSIRFTDHSNEVFTIPAVYESGLEGVYTNGDRLAFFEKLTVSCPDPFWTSQEVQQVEWVYAPGEPFLDARKLSASSLSGSRQIVNSGDVESLPTWVFEGPFDGFTVDINGVGFEFEGSLLLGESLTVRHDGWSWTVIDGTGASAFTDVAWGARFPAVPAGESTVTLNLDNADTGTRVSMFWPERREVMF